MEHRQIDFVIQFGFENWIIKSFCLCSTTDGTFLPNLYPSRRRTSLKGRRWLVVPQLFEILGTKTENMEGVRLVTTQTTSFLIHDKS